MNESYLLMSLRLKKVKMYIECEKYDGAVRMLEAIMTTENEHIKIQMFLGNIYMIQKMYPDAIQCLHNAQTHVSKRVMGKGLIKNRIKKRFYDIGVLGNLPDLCIQTILAKV